MLPKEIETTAMLDIRKFMCENYKKHEFVEDGFFKKCTEKFDVQFLRCIHTPLNFLSDYRVVFYQTSTMARPEKINLSIQTLAGLPTELRKYLYAYCYIKADGEKQLFLFSKPEFASKYFYDEKRNMETEWLFDNGIISIAKSKEMPQRSLKLVFHGKINEFKKEILQPVIPKTKELKYLIDLESENTCKILPYLLTSFTVQQQKCSLFTRSTAKVSDLLTVTYSNALDRNYSRDLRHLEKIAKLFSFSSPCAKTPPKLVGGEIDDKEPRPFVVDLSKEPISSGRGIVAIFSLWTYIISETEGLKIPFDLAVSLALLQENTHCFDIEPLRKNYEELHLLEDEACNTNLTLATVVRYLPKGFDFAE